jgi:hypothetical protein
MTKRKLHVQVGVYRHYKSHLYRVIGMAKHSETLEDLVVYEALESHGKFQKGQRWVRPASMFLEKVLVQGKQTPRFTRIQTAK